MSEKNIVRAILCLMVVVSFSATKAMGENILFIVNADQASFPNDALIGDFLESLGHTVTYFDDTEDEAATEAAAAAADLVYISESVGSGDIREEITEIEVPIIVGEPYAWDEMGMTLGGGGTSAVATTDITIVSPGHPLAAGLSGTVTVLTDITGSEGTAEFAMGDAGDEATVIATVTLADGQTYDTIIIYEKGAALAVPPTDGSEPVAADIRIGMFFHYFAHDVLNENAYALIEAAVKYVFGAKPQARNPDPPDGTIYPDIWVTLGWTPGDFAASHDVYLGDNFDDVNDGVGGTFIGNQTLEFIVAGFPGYPYPDGLVPGTTYYWRIDEVNDADPNSPWKGFVWSFTVPPKTAYGPDPAQGAGDVDLNVQLSWTAGFGAKLHYIVFGEDFDEVNDAAAGIPNGPANYTPGPLELAKTYYWRVDEFDGDGTHKGEVWSFTTLGAVSGPNPVDGAVDVKPSVILSWDAGAVAASHELYFGMDADAVANATKTSPEYKGPKALGQESYDPGKLILNTAYYWRIDEVNGVNPDSPWAGNVWTFTTGDFFVIDDFEIYDANDDQIWYSWHDGLGYGAPGTPDYFAGNGTGAAVGDETTASYTEETIVHGGSQSMPVAYDNNKQGYSKYSQVEYTLTDQRDWTEEGVAELSLWFYGDPANATDRLYVAIANPDGIGTGAPAVVYHDDPAAATIDIWTEWVIPLQAFAEKGIVLTNVDRIAIGMGTQGNMTIPGGSGKMLIDDVRLNQLLP